MSFYRYAYEIYDGGTAPEYHRSLTPIPRENIAALGLFTYRYYTSESENQASDGCYVVSLGYERRPHGISKHRNSSYNRYSFHYFVKGTGSYQESPLGAGQLLMIPPCEPLYFESNPDDPLEFYYLSVSGDGSETLLRQAGFDRSVYLSECPFAAQIPQLFDAPLFEEHPETDPSFYLMGFFLQLMGRHKKHNVSAADLPKEKSYFYYSQAIHYIESYLLSDLSPKGIADFLHVSHSYLRKVFSLHCHCSVRDYILQKRIKYAADQLALTKCSVSEAANAIGYDDYTQFSKMFKKIMGTPPSHYRSSQKGG